MKHILRKYFTLKAQCFTLFDYFYTKGACFLKRIVVTGALGQIGTELVEKLRKLYGEENVLATDIKKRLTDSGPFQIVDVMDGKKLFEVVRKFRADTIIHLAALLSATAEKNPLLAWTLNMNGLVNALETARELQLQLFTPSSIGAFGPSTPKENTPQLTIQRPTTMYGINKVAGELLCDYYYKKYGVDTRSVRFPGLISNVTPPGGGTTDYAVDIYYQAVTEGRYTSYIEKGTWMDMMYMPDALQAIIDLMEADGGKLVHRNAYNISAMSVEPSQIASEIRKTLPHFEMDYAVDPLRQAIAESWPNAIDCSVAKEEWGFRVQYDLEKMTKDMLEKLQEKFG